MATKRDTPLSVLARFYAAERIYMSAAPGTGDFTGMATTLSHTILLYQSPDLLYGGVYEGHEGFLAWSSAMAALFDKVDVQDPETLEGEDKVVVLSALKLRIRKTGEEVEIKPFVQIMGFDLSGGEGKGVISEIRPVYWDVAGLNKKLEKNV